MATNILAKMAVQIVANNAQFATAMKNSQAQMASFQRTAQTLNSTLQGFGVGLGLMELARGVQFAISTIADFEKTMSEVKAITGATGKDFRALEDDAKRLGGATKFTATEVAQLQIAYGRLGFSTREILDATEATLALAAATGEDLAKSADVAGSTVRGFGLDANETLRVVDVMASSFNKTALGLENFTESMKYVAPVGNAAGASVEEVTAMLGVLADAGIRGSMAGTSLRKIFTDMTRDGRPLQERLAELAEKGITLSDSMDEVGRTAQTSLLILSKNTEKTAALTKELQNASGEAQKMAEIMQDNLSGDVTKLGSAIEGLTLKFSDGSGALREFVQSFTELVMLIADDDVVRGIKAWFGLATIVPRKTLELISAIVDAFKDEAAEFKKMQEERRKIWEQKTKQQLNEEIKKTNDLAEATKKYTAVYSQLLKIAGFSRPSPDRVRPDTSEFYQRDINMDPGNGLLTRDEIENPVDGLVKEIEYNDKIADQLANYNKLKDEQLDKMMATAQMAETMGMAIGDAFAQMLVGEKNFAAGLARITEQILTLYLQQSIAAMIKSAMEDPSMPLPFGKIAIAAAGIGAVKALFSGIGASGGGGSVGGSTSNPPGRMPSEYNVNIDGRLRGYDLGLVNDKTSYRRSMMG